MLVITLTVVLLTCPGLHHGPQSHYVIAAATGQLRVAVAGQVHLAVVTIRPRSRRPVGSSQGQAGSPTPPKRSQGWTSAALGRRPPRQVRTRLAERSPSPGRRTRALRAGPHRSGPGRRRDLVAGLCRARLPATGRTAQKRHADLARRRPRPPSVDIPQARPAPGPPAATAGSLKPGANPPEGDDAPASAGQLQLQLELTA
jgi:hypothetical protein